MEYNGAGMKKIVYTHDNGVALLSPNPNVQDIEAIAARNIPEGVPYLIVEDHQLPSGCDWVNAWQIDFTNKKVVIDIDQARNIRREQLRNARASKLSMLDVAYQRADENNNSELKQQIAQRKQALRDITAHPDLESATTVQELLSVRLPD